MPGLEQVSVSPRATRRPWQRAPERRRGIAAVIAAVAAAAPLAREPRLLRQRFEDELRELIHARAVELRDVGTEPTRQDVSVTIDVAVGSSMLGAIDAVFDAGRHVDDWTRQCIASACPLAAVVLVLERAHRASGTPVRTDGAAPIIGSCPRIRLVRERIERVAATDFTVLVEGGIDAHAHPDFIAV